jgi:hypothetical protein
MADGTVTIDVTMNTEGLDADIADIMQKIDGVLTGIKDTGNAATAALNGGNLKDVASAVGTLKKNLDNALPSVAAVDAAFAAFQLTLTIAQTIDAVAKGIGALTTAMNTLKTAGTVGGLLTGGAIWLAIAAGIAAVAAAVVLLTPKAQESDEAMKALREETEKLAGEQQNYSKAQEQELAALADNEAAATRQLGRVDRLAEEYTKLASGSKGVTEATRSEAAVLGELAELVPAVANAYDQQTGALKLTHQELSALITAEQSRDVMALANEEIRAAEDRIDAANALKDSLDAQSTALENRKTALETYLNDYGAYDDGQWMPDWGLGDKINDYIGWAEELEKINDLLVDNEATSNALAGSITQNATIITDASATYNSAAEDLASVGGEEFIAGIEAKLAAWEEYNRNVASAQEQLIADMEASYDRYIDIALDGANKLNTESGLTAEVFAQNIRDNTKALVEWGNGIKDIEAKAKALNIEVYTPINPITGHMLRARLQSYNVYKGGNGGGHPPFLLRMKKNCPSQGIRAARVNFCLSDTKNLSIDEQLDKVYAKHIRKSPRGHPLDQKEGS